jgi:hypothetical protein
MGECGRSCGDFEKMKKKKENLAQKSLKGEKAVNIEETKCNEIGKG